MLEQVKAIYYPNTILQIDETRFGSKRLLSQNNPYVKPLTNKKELVVIDMLECMRNIWGDSILLSRDNVYALVSGDVDMERYRKIICTYYKTHSAFACYVDRIMIFGQRQIPFINRFAPEVRSYLNAYKDEVDAIVHTYTGSKFLLEDKEYRYYAVSPACDLSAVKGVRYIK